MLSGAHHHPLSTSASSSAQPQIRLHSLCWARRHWCAPIHQLFATSSRSLKRKREAKELSWAHRHPLSATISSFSAPRRGSKQIHDLAHFEASDVEGERPPPLEEWWSDESTLPPTPQQLSHKFAATRCDVEKENEKVNLQHCYLSALQQ